MAGDPESDAARAQVLSMVTGAIDDWDARIVAEARQRGYRSTPLILRSLWHRAVLTGTYIELCMFDSMFVLKAVSQ